MDTDTDSIVKQRRESFSNTGGGGQARPKVIFFIEDDNSMQNLGQTTGHEIATSVAVAAAAYAVHSLDVANTNGKNLTKQKSLKSDDQLVEIEATNTGQSSMKRPSSEAPLDRKPSKISSSSFRAPTSTISTSTDAKIDIWERNEVEKIKKRYAKIRSGIQSWEDYKKSKVKNKLQKKKIVSECKKGRNQQQYQFKTERMNGIIQGARAEMLKKMTREETAVKERAKKIRSGRGAPYFLCF